MRTRISLVVLFSFLAQAAFAGSINDFVVFSGNSTNVSGTVQSGLLGSNGTVTYNGVTYPGSTPPPSNVIPDAGIPIPSADSFSAGGPFITGFNAKTDPSYSDNNSITLAPGSYGSLTLNSGTQFFGAHPYDLNLTPGNYYFYGIDLTGQFFNPLMVNLQGVTPGHGVHIYSYGNIDMNDNVQMTINGQQPSSSLAYLSPSISIETLDSFNEHNAFFNGFNGTVFAPYGNVIFDTSVSGPTFTGHIIAGQNASVGAFFKLTTVPEPSTLVLLGLGVPALVCFRRRRIKLEV